MTPAPCTYKDREGRCDADDGFPCAKCVERDMASAAYWAGQWVVASPEERDPEKYRAEMIEAGRGRLVRR